MKLITFTIKTLKKGAATMFCVTVFPNDLVWTVRKLNLKHTSVLTGLNSPIPFPKSGPTISMPVASIPHPDGQCAIATESKPKGSRLHPHHVNNPWQGRERERGHWDRKVCKEVLDKTKNQFGHREQNMGSATSQRACYQAEKLSSFLFILNN